MFCPLCEETTTGPAPCPLCGGEVLVDADSPEVAGLLHIRERQAVMRHYLRRQHGLLGLAVLGGALSAGGHVTLPSLWWGLPAALCCALPLLYYVVAAPPELNNTA